MKGLTLAGWYALVLSVAILVAQLLTIGCDDAYLATVLGQPGPAGVVVKEVVTALLGLALLASGIGLFFRSRIARTAFFIVAPWASIALAAALAGILWRNEVPVTRYLVVAYALLAFSLSRGGVLKSVGAKTCGWVSRGGILLVACAAAAGLARLAIMAQAPAGTADQPEVAEALARHAPWLAVFDIILVNYAAALLAVSIPTKFEDLGRHSDLTLSWTTTWLRRIDAVIGRTFLFVVALSSTLAVLFIFFFIGRDTVPFFQIRGANLNGTLVVPLARVVSIDDLVGRLDDPLARQLVLRHYAGQQHGLTDLTRKLDPATAEQFQDDSNLTVQAVTDDLDGDALRSIVAREYSIEALAGAMPREIAREIVEQRKDRLLEKLPPEQRVSIAIYGSALHELPWFDAGDWWAAATEFFGVNNWYPSRQGDWAHIHGDLWARLEGSRWTLLDTKLGPWQRESDGTWTPPDPDTPPQMAGVEHPTNFGALAMFFGSMIVTLGSCLVAVPVGVSAAVCLSDVLPFRIRQAIKPVVEVLAAIPSVTFGFFGLVVVAPLLQQHGSTMLSVATWVVGVPVALIAITVVSDLLLDKVRGPRRIPLRAALMGVLGAAAAWGLYAAGGYFGAITITNGTNALNASVMLGIMALPTVVSVSEDALTAAGRELREGSYALGATRAETILKVIIPAARSGIFAAVILGVMRAIGETMVVWMVSGNATQIPSPWWDLTRPVRTLTATIAGDMGEAEHSVGAVRYHTYFAMAMSLLVFCLVCNLVSEWFVRRSVKQLRGG